MKSTKNLLGLAVILLAFSCTETDRIEDEIVLDNSLFDGILSLPSSLLNYSNIRYPQHFYERRVTDIDNTPGNNQITDAGASLGRVLFYDTKLSANNTVACASCHLQANAFADPKKFSEGFEGGLTGRNSMGLSNAKYYENGAFFWDERASSLEEQTLMPIQDHIEMGLTLDELVTKIQAESYYNSLFSAAFNNDEVTSNKIALALSQFVRSMVSYESKFDEGLGSVGGNNIDAKFSNFSDLENLGKNLFMSGRTDCNRCHETAMFSGDRARNNGLDASTTDQGLGAVTGNSNDDGKFKTNSLRNIELTGPYMHDGRFTTLEEVIEHYNSGIQDHPNLDNRLRDRNNNRPVRMNLSQNEKNALVAFLKTLTDYEFINDEKFCDPFIK
jgi:cytochrome c peroxidase